MNKTLSYLALIAQALLVLGMGAVCIWLLLVLDLLVGYKWVLRI